MRHKPGTEVVQRLLRQVRFLRRQPQRMVPQEVELQLLQRILVGQVEHLLQQQHPQQGLHRPVGTPVVLAIQVGKPRLIDQGQCPQVEHLGPTALQQPRLLRWHQELRLQQAPLRTALSEHQPLPIGAPRAFRPDLPILPDHALPGSFQGGFYERINVWKQTGNRFIVSCRSIDYTGVPEGFRLWANGLNVDEISEFVELRLPREAATKVHYEVTREPVLRDLARSPHLLSMICDEIGHLDVKNIGSLVSRFVDRQLILEWARHVRAMETDWRVVSGEWRRRSKTWPGSEVMWRALGYYAWRGVEAEGPGSRCALEVALSWIRDSFRERKLRDIDPSGVLRVGVGASLLDVDLGTMSVRFSHESLQELFAGSFLVESPSNLIDVVLPSLLKPQNAYVCIFAASLMDDPDTLLAALANRDVLLAASCACHAKVVSPDRLEQIEEDLELLLDSPFKGRREAALYRLAMLGGRNARRIFAHVLKAQDVDVLGIYHPPLALELARELSAQKGVRRRLRSVNLLQYVNGRDAQLELLRMCRDQSTPVRRAAIGLLNLRQRADKELISERDIDEWFSPLLARETDIDVLGHVFGTIAASLGPGELWSRLETAYRENEALTYWPPWAAPAVTNALGQVPFDTVLPVALRLFETGRLTLEHAAWLLGHAQTASPTLFAMLSNEKRSPRKKLFLRALLYCPHNSAGTQQIRAALHDPDPEVRAEAIWNFEQRPDGAAVPDLRHCLDDARPDIHVGAALALAKLQVPSAESILLSLAVQPATEPWRLRIVQTLGQMGSLDSLAILLQFSRRRRWALFALESLVQIAERFRLFDRESGDPWRILHAVLSQRHASVLLELARSWERSQPEKIVPLLRKALHGRRTAANAVFLIGELRLRNFLVDLQTCLNSENAEVRFQGLYALEALQGREAVGSIRTLLRDHEQKVRDAAYYLLEYMRQPIGIGSHDIDFIEGPAAGR